MLMKAKARSKSSVSSKPAAGADKGMGKATGKPERTAPGVPSLVSAGVTLKGSFVSDGEVQFDGVIEGDIRAEQLVIGAGASVVGEVRADRVRVSGTVEGVVRAKRVELASTAIIKGDVLHAALTVETGARLDGKVCCVQDPLRRAKGVQAAAGLPTEKVEAELAEHARHRSGEAAPRRGAAEAPAAEGRSAAA